MVRSLENAFNEVSKLPEDEQERIAQFILAEMESERRWNDSFARSQDVLEKLANAALAEHAKGLTQPFEQDSDLPDH